ANTILEIDHLQVHEDRLKGLSVFQMRKYPGTCCVTRNVAQRIRETKLDGFELRKLWPLPEHIPYCLHRKHAECHDELTALSIIESRPIKGNSVVLRLALEGEDPSLEESARFEKIADQLDSMLVNPGKNSQYFGNLEIAEFVTGEGRYFFSCP